MAFAARLGGSIDWDTTLLFTTAAIAGVGAGTSVADRIQPQTMQRGFAVLLVGVALYTGGRAAVGIW